MKTKLQRAASLLGRKGGVKGGKSKSEAKTAAARANGAKGGRPLEHGVTAVMSPAYKRKRPNKNNCGLLVSGITVHGKQRSLRDGRGRVVGIAFYGKDKP